MSSSALGILGGPKHPRSSCQTNEICIIFSHYDYSSLLTYTAFFN